LDGAGLHIVYGPNEAGKSSALRGLKALLYGVEERTLDNFIHANDKLRIVGRLRMDDGKALSFVRRKGRKNTLLTPAGEVLDEQVLAPFLLGVNQQLFQTLFGIDHAALVQGGQEILEQKGEVGQALFSAALGSHALHRLMAQLDEEADALFRPRGSNQKLNSALNSYHECNKRIRESSLSSSMWEEQRSALERTTKELEAIQSELTGSRTEVNRLQRIQRVLPKLARRRELSGELKSLGDVVVLSPDFALRRQKTVNALETARAIVVQAAPRLDELLRQLEGLSVNRALLDQAERIEELHARLGGYRKSLQERPHIEAEARLRLNDAASILKEIHPDLEPGEIEQLRFVPARQKAVSEAGSRKSVLISQINQLESALTKAQNRLREVRRAVAENPESNSPEALLRAISTARKEGDLDRTILAIRSELAKLQAECTDALSRLAFWNGALEDLAGLCLPNRESINHYEAEYDELRTDLQRLEGEREKTANALQETLLRLDEIRLAGNVPTEADLTDSRSRRDRVWQLLRRHWVGGEEVSAEASRYGGEGALPDLFENRLMDADELSDRLRREADRVAEMATLQARQAAGQRQIAEISGQLELCGDRKQRLDADWRTLWRCCGIVPRAPREMRTWLDECEKLRQRAAELHTLDRRHRELEQTRKKHIGLLNRQLTQLGAESLAGEELESVLAESEVLARQLDQRRRKRDMLQKEMEEREADMESLAEEHRLATAALAAWARQWADSMESFGLRSDASPSEAGDYIEKVRLLFSIEHEAEKLRMRLDSVDQDVASFRREVEKLVAGTATELSKLPADDALMRIKSLLSETRDRETRRQQMAAEVARMQREIRDSQASIRAMTDRLESLCIEAKANAPEELEAAERRSVQFHRIREKIESIEQQILDAGEGANIAALEAESAGTHPDTLPGRIDELRNRIEDELEPKRIELAQTKGREEKELELMDGSDRAALLADRAQAILATIRTEAERYVQVKLAGKILRDQIELYRRENQGPLVRRAGEHFAALTLGSFEALTTHFNERDEPVLAGVRPGGEQVYVEGMSAGTRDQLYLALRLASLEKYMESSEPMPFIVDDVLVDFDDRRSQAALQALATLAEKTQVILFTHHSRLVEQAGQLQGPVQVHALGAAAIIEEVESRRSEPIDPPLIIREKIDRL